MSVPFSLASAPSSLHVGEVSEAMGFTQFWGNSFACDLLNEPFGEPERPSGLPVNILMTGAGDIRHILKTVARRHVDEPPLHFYVHESSAETIARHIFFLDLVTNPKLTIRERCELFLSLYANALVRKKDARYLSEQVGRLQALVSGDTEDDRSLAGLSKLVDFSTLKFRDRDAVHEAIGFWRESVEFDARNLRDQRLRGYYKTRYDHRKNLLDWDYHNGIKPVAPAVHWQEYKSFGMTGVCYETRLGTYDEPNRTMASYVDGRCRSRGTSVQVRGFWGDIINSPFPCFGAEAYNKCDQERLFKISNEQHVHSSHEIADFNLACMLTEIATRQVKTLPPKSKEEDSYPYKSPLERVRCTIEEVDEEDSEADSGKGGRGRSLPAGFESVRVHFLLGDLTTDTLPKYKYKRFFDRIFVGESLAETLHETAFHATRLIEEESGKALAEALVLSGDSRLSVETFRHQVHLSGKQKLVYRRKVEEACGRVELEPVTVAMKAPNSTEDMKPGEARKLEESLPSIVHYRLADRVSQGA
ncbi:motile cilium assembly [Perkinsus olseni]|uniref:Motile cilium assembly n=1 Tax=Perkinsus olseni TaxID=32597 RepID=A0A7J6LA16_PEROL|nr:motile cilium assembly [Perkinsus olseni]